MNRRRKDLFVLVAMAFGVTLWFGTDLYSQGGEPCSGDVAKFCKDVKWGAHSTFPPSLPAPSWIP